MRDAAPPQLDPEVIRRCRRGDVSALGEIYEHFGRRVHGICRRILGRDPEAEDAAEEVFLRVFKKLPTFSGEARFSTWLYRLTVNHALNMLKYEKRRRTADLPSSGEKAPLAPSEPPERSLERLEAQALVDSLLASLTPRQRAILTLRELGGLSYAEISKSLDIPMGTVMSRLSRARRRLLEAGLARGLAKQLPE